MRKTYGITIVLSKIKDRYQILSNVYSNNAKELLDIFNKLKNEGEGERIQLAEILQRKLYNYTELIIQLQNWLDDVQSLEISNGLETKINEIYEISKKEKQLIDELKILIKDYAKSIGNRDLSEEIKGKLDKKMKSLVKSVNDTLKKSNQLHKLIFSKQNLINSLSEHI
ncbi:MAG: hypothetical protein ACTSYR_01465 [Candidatus Odinarchaeia archaeon]